MSKLKELHRRSTIAWSVSSGRPDLLAAGTMAGTVGLDFDTSAQLEVFSLDLDNSSQSMTLVGKTTSTNMFHKIVWGQSTNGKYGILAGGMDNGTITIWDPSKISTYVCFFLFIILFYRFLYILLIHP
jgi:protein transport protein SEC31